MDTLSRVPISLPVQDALLNQVIDRLGETDAITV
jgi:hypothetical protein